MASGLLSKEKSQIDEKVAKKLASASFAEKRFQKIIRERSAKAATFLSEEAKKFGSAEMGVLAARVTQINDTATYRSARSMLQRVVNGGIAGVEAFCAEQQNQTNHEVARVQAEKKKTEGDLGALALKADAVAKKVATFRSTISSSQQQLVALTKQQADEVKRSPKQPVDHSHASRHHAKKIAFNGNKPKVIVSKDSIDLKEVVSSVKKQFDKSDSLLKNLASQESVASRAVARAHQERELESTIKSKLDGIVDAEKAFKKMKANLVDKAHAYQVMQGKFAQAQHNKQLLDQRCASAGSQKHVDKEAEVKALGKALKLLSGEA